MKSANAFLRNSRTLTGRSNLASLRCHLRDSTTVQFSRKGVFQGRKLFPTCKSFPIHLRSCRGRAFAMPARIAIHSGTVVLQLRWLARRAQMMALPAVRIHHRYRLGQEIHAPVELSLAFAAAAQLGWLSQESESTRLRAQSERRRRAKL